MSMMPFRTVLLLLTLMHVTRGFSNSGGSCSICLATNDNLSKNLLSNALRSSRNPKKNAFPRASSTSSTSLNVIGSSTKTVKASGEVLSALRDRLLPVIMSKLDRIYVWNLPRISILSLSETFVPFLRKYWWLSPMSLVLIPLYCAIFKGTCAAMPDWWNVVPMDHIAAADNSQWIIGHFLASNISYFASGTYLMLKRFPLILKMKTGGIKVRLTRFSMLGMWIFLAGAMSTVFHSVQALGSYPLSQSLCYLDHAVAGSAFCYFLKTCGSPSRRVWSVGSAALLTLVVTSPGYTFLHSFWHYLSAATATLWALEGYARLIPSRTANTK